MHRLIATNSLREALIASFLCLGFTGCGASAVDGTVDALRPADAQRSATSSLTEKAGDKADRSSTGHGSTIEDPTVQEKEPENNSAGKLENENAIEVKEMINIVVERENFSSNVYAEGFRDGDRVTAEVKKAWDQKINEVKKEMINSSQFSELQEGGLEPRIVGPYESLTGRHKGKMRITISYIIIE